MSTCGGTFAEKIKKKFDSIGGTVFPQIVKFEKTGYKDLQRI